jgi:hypothetical protein
MAMLGGVSVTGIVLVIGFMSNLKADPSSVQINTLTLVFAVAFAYFIQTAYTLSYLPDRALVGEPLFRLYYSLASTLQYRTVNLLVFGLTNVAAYFELGPTMRVLDFLIPAMLIGAFLLVATVADAFGLIRFGECYVALGVGLVLGALFLAAMHRLDMDDGYAQMSIALVFAGVNGVSFVTAGLVPLSSGRPGLRAFLLSHARRLTLVDMQITIVSLIVLWLAVAGLV